MRLRVIRARTKLIAHVPQQVVVTFECPAEPVTSRHVASRSSGQAELMMAEPGTDCLHLQFAL